MTNHRFHPSKQYTTLEHALRASTRVLVGAIALALLLSVQSATPATAKSLSETDSPGDARAGSQTTTHDVYLPQLAAAREHAAVCPTVSSADYGSVPVAGPRTDRPPHLHADLNLSLRGYSTVSRPLVLVDINGQADPDAPQLSAVSNAAARLEFVETHRVNEWDWACEVEHGCRGEPITSPPVTLLSLASRRGAPVRTPTRNAEIYTGGYVALVLYAEERRITLTYTRGDSAAVGYVVHIEDFCVDPALLALYEELHAAGRSRLPALHSLEQLGTGNGRPLKIAIRDTGSFMDPRSRKDWWKVF